MNSESTIASNSKQDTSNIILYSARAIALATFLGGPIAAGYLISKNYTSLNKPQQAKTALIIGIIFTFIILGSFFLIPDNILDTIPNYLIPVVYSGIIMAIVEVKLGNQLRVYKENGHKFASIWKAVGVGFISLLIFLVLTLGLVFLKEDSLVYDQYDKEIALFTQNEKETMIFYDHLDSRSQLSLLQELNNSVIPKWKKNLDIVQRIDKLENLPKELTQQNKLLLKYSQLRIETFELFKTAIEEDSDKYNQQLDSLHTEINKQLELLN